MNIIFSAIRTHQTHIIAGLALLCLILFIWNIALGARISKLARRKNAKIADGGVMEIAKAIDDLWDKNDETDEKLEYLVNRIDKSDERALECIRKIGLVRYNAFEDVAGDQSVALALLDDRNDGVVFNILNSRLSSSVYAKSVKGGEAERTLSAEETEALRRATE